jgi:protein-disulfide isomerase
MNLRAIGIAWLAGGLWLTGAARAAEVPACASLPPEARARAEEALAKLYPYDGCDQTFARCLAQPEPAPVVLRLAADVCRRVGEGQDAKAIEHALGKRARSVLPLGKRATIALDEANRVGEPEAPVVIAVYACARCPFCKVLLPELHHEVTAGSLKGKARMYFRPFPIKGHPGSAEGGLAYVAAARMQRLWPVVLDLYARYDAYCPQKFGAWAAELGLDRQAFEALMADPGVRAELVAAKQEGVRNRVKATPTVFLDGVEYVYELKTAVLVDVVEELAARAR